MIGFSFPDISPVMLEIGPIVLRWYSMAYLLGILFSWFMVKRFVAKYNYGLTKENLADLAFYITIGIIVGGRLGYVLFYGGKDNPFFENPLYILEIWKGGMSFHGGILGVIVAMYWYARKIKYPFLKMTDVIVPTVPFGIFLGRIANFINGELWGRVTDVPWAVRFPAGGYEPRHPSQIYEAFLEGLVLYIVLNILFSKKWVRERVGFTSAMFIILYTVFRMFVELFREPDVHMGYFFGFMTMGQLLSIPFLLAAIYVIWRPAKP